MRTLLISPLLVLLATSLGAQQQLAPYGTPKSLLPSVSTATSSGNQNQASAAESFEAYVVSAGGAENILSLSLDDTTVSGTGQGPNLVLDGVTYSCIGSSLQWNGDGYFGLSTKTLLGNASDGQLTMRYDSGQSSIAFDLHAFDGFGDTAVVTVYDIAGAILFISGSINVPDSSPVHFSYTDTDIGSVVISSMVYSWSPIIDNHEYGAGGPSLRITGNCGSVMTADVVNATPFGPVAIIYSFGTGSFVVPSGPCAGTVLGLDGVGITLLATPFADGAGAATYSTLVAPFACGAVFVQALDVATCGTTNVVGI
jgi:hypothetical protein